MSRDQERSLEATAADGSFAQAGSDSALVIGSTLGRYVVLRPLGEGAMGQVYVGFDVQLDRKVALKVIRPGALSSQVRERTLREAQALAKLSHPNVVQVYEVGEHRGRFFLAMEFVDGSNLRDWLKMSERSWQQRLSMVVSAGHGLVAAHAIGLIHRDVKPDNILVGHDGRARIADFGLVRALEMRSSDDLDGGAVANIEPLSMTMSRSSSGQAWAEIELTQAGRSIGTPAYMSPEQQLGGDVDARTDQFSLCVTLYEALYGFRPFTGRTMEALRKQVISGEIRPPPADSSVPRWIGRTLLRGLAPAPSERWPSVEALLNALARDPSRRRRTAAALTLGVGLIAAASYSLASLRDEHVPPCQGAADEFAEVWNQSRREAMRAGLSADEGLLSEMTIPRVELRLDDYADAWIGLHTETCLSHQRGALSPLLLDLSMSCLNRHRGVFAAVVDVLTEAEPGTLENAVLTAANLPRVATCTDTEALLAATPPLEDADAARDVETIRGELGRALALEGAGRYDDGVALITRFEPKVASLDYPPLTAELRHRHGSLLMWSARYEEADIVLSEAYADAIRGRQDALAGESLAKRIFVVAEGLDRVEDALAWFPQAKAWASRLEDARELRALIFNNTAIPYAESGQLSEALTMSLEARDLWTDVHGEAHPQVGLNWSNIAELYSDLGRCDEALAAHETAQRLLRATLGSEHPIVMMVETNQCALLECRGDFAAAVECAAKGKSLVLKAMPSAMLHARMNVEAISMHRNMNDEKGAMALADEVLTLVTEEQDPRSRAIALTVLGELALLKGVTELAEAYLKRAHKLFTRDEHLSIFALRSEAGIAALELERGQIEEARARLDKLIDRGEARFPEQPWALAPPRFVLARLTAATGDLEAARAQARRVDADLAKFGYFEEYRRAEIRAWLARLGTTPPAPRLRP